MLYIFVIKSVYKYIFETHNLNTKYVMKTVFMSLMVGKLLDICYDNPLSVNTHPNIT